MATVKLRGKEIHISGASPEVGTLAPDFILVNSKLEDCSLATYKGKKKLLSIFPSLDTPVCIKSTKRFNATAANQKDTFFLMVSADLPFAMKRFCDAESADNIITLSMMRSRDFAKDYGILIKDGALAGITARAIFVLNEDNKIIYKELVPDIAQEPNYTAALAAL